MKILSGKCLIDGICKFASFAQFAINARQIDGESERQMGGLKLISGEAFQGHFTKDWGVTERGGGE